MIVDVGAIAEHDEHQVGNRPQDGAVAGLGALDGSSQLGFLLLLRVFRTSPGPTELANEDVNRVGNRVERVVTR